MNIQQNSMFSSKLSSILYHTPPPQKKDKQKRHHQVPVRFFSDKTADIDLHKSTPHEGLLFAILVGANVLGKFNGASVFESFDIGKKMLLWLVVSTHLKNISQIGSFPQIGMKIKIFETTSQYWIVK